MFSAPLLRCLVWVLTPFNFLFGLWKKLLSKIVKSNDNPSITEEELITIVEEAEQELQCSTAGKLSQSRMPKLKFLRPVSQKNESVVMAAQVRKRVLVA